MEIALNPKDAKHMKKMRAQDFAVSFSYFPHWIFKLSGRIFVTWTTTQTTVYEDFEHRVKGKSTHSCYLKN